MDVPTVDLETYSADGTFLHAKDEVSSAHNLGKFSIAFLTPPFSPFSRYVDLRLARGISFGAFCCQVPKWAAEISTGKGPPPLLLLDFHASGKEGSLFLFSQEAAAPCCRSQITNPISVAYQCVSTCLRNGPQGKETGAVPCPLYLCPD